MSNPKHSRGPWSSSGHKGKPAIWDRDSCLIAELGTDFPEDKANAARIVHCVNLYDELLRELKHAVELIPPRFQKDSSGDRIHKLIARAEGKEL